MKVRENLDVSREILELLRKEERRSNSYSVTKLVCCPRKTYYAFSGVKEYISDDTQLIFARGRAHHGVLEVYPTKEIAIKKEARCGKIIWGDMDMRGDRITEIFTTTIGANRVKEPEDAIKVFPMKISQLKAYDYMTGETMGDLLVFFLFGDYSRFEEVMGKKIYTGIRPQLRCFTFDFEKDETAEVWEQMNTNLEEIECALKDHSPPLLTGMKFECDNCGYASICLGEEPIVERSEFVI